jgi:hypothetical protein
MARDAKARAAAHGLAPRELIENTRPGAVFTVKDIAIQLPEERIPNAPPRTPHPNRRVIIMQEEALSQAAEPKTLLVIPCSASRGGAERWNFGVPMGEPGFDKPVVVAFTTLAQPILKSDLDAFCDQITDDTLTALRRRLLENLGIATPIAAHLPPRDEVAVEHGEGQAEAPAPDVSSPEPPK